MIENDESYAIDEYFFTFFSFGEDVLNVLSTLVGSKDAPEAHHELTSSTRVDSDQPERRARSPAAQQSLDLLRADRRDRSSTPLREGVRATLTPFTLDEAGKMSPRMSGEFT